MTQRTRQLNRYKNHRPQGTYEYTSGEARARSDLKFSKRSDCPYHADSGRALRWWLGYQDEILRLATVLFKESDRMNIPCMVDAKLKR